MQKMSEVKKEYTWEDIAHYLINSPEVMWFENGTEMCYGVFWNPEKGGLYYGDCRDQDTIHAFVRANYLEDPPEFDDEDLDLGEDPDYLARVWVDEKESLNDEDFIGVCYDLAIELNKAIRDYGDF